LINENFEEKEKQTKNESFLLLLLLSSQSLHEIGKEKNIYNEITVKDTVH